MRLSRNTNATIRDNRYFYTWRTNDEPHEIFRYLQLALVGYSVKDIFNITPLRQTCTLLLFESYALPMIYKYLKRFFSYTLFFVFKTGTSGLATPLRAESSLALCSFSNFFFWGITRYNYISFFIQETGITDITCILISHKDKSAFLFPILYEFLIRETLRTVPFY